MIKHYNVFNIQWCADGDGEYECTWFEVLDHNDAVPAARAMCEMNGLRYIDCVLDSAEGETYTYVMRHA